MPTPKPLKLPAKVLAQAKAVVPQAPRKPVPAVKNRGAAAREKVITALKKLHPMD